MKSMIIVLLLWEFCGGAVCDQLPVPVAKYEIHEMAKCANEGTEALRRGDGFAWQCVKMVDMNADDKTPLNKTK